MAPFSQNLTMPLSGESYLFPSLITVFAGFAYAKWWSHDVVQQIFGAVMPIATGLMLGTTLRLLKA
ncbi:hypothetical protein, partial [Klebsiella variicola]|uniref:hypothetical protein n=1 Tax=Klebsiella variicola TaxID=244366 RepID=UPI002732020A